MQLRGRLWICGLLIGIIGCTDADQNSLTNHEDDIVIEFSDNAFLHVTEDESPNVVLVTIDTLRADYLSAYGGPAYTPNLNQLAERGWLFENCYSTSMLTNPSHASIMTSLFPKDHGVYDNQSGIQDGLPTLAQAMQRRGYRTLAVVSFPHLNQETSNLGQGFDRIIQAKNQSRNAHEAMQHALSLIDELQYDDKFFIWVHLVDPHAPYHATSDHHARHPGKIHSKPMRLARKTAPGFQKKNKWFRWAMKKFRTTAPLVRRYISEIQRADEGLGELMDGLNQRGHGADTAYFITSDHGENLGEHNLFFHHGGLYQETVHVPLVAYVPDRLPSISSELVQTVDIAPTILEITNTPLWSPMRGLTLVDIAAGKALGRSFVFSEHMNAQMVSVRSAHSSLIVHRKSASQFPAYRMRRGQSEFYDLRKDPKERRPIKANSAERARLEAQLDLFLNDSYEFDPRPAYAQDLDSLRALGYLD